MKYNENVVHEEKYRGYEIQIAMDDGGGDSPRDWDNLGTMVCWHGRSKLGDEQPRCSPRDFIIKLIDEAPLPKSTYIPTRYNGDVLWYLEELEDKILYELFRKYYVWLPIYAYEHGGITISTSRSGYPYNDRFDSGTLGFIYCSKSDAKDNWNKGTWTKELEDKTLSLLEAEIQTYDDYLTGNVYGYMIKKLDNDGDPIDEVVESCWGYYPEHDNRSDHAECLDAAKSVVEFLADRDDREKEMMFKRIYGEVV